MATIASMSSVGSQGFRFRCARHTQPERVAVVREHVCYVQRQRVRGHVRVPRRRRLRAGGTWLAVLFWRTPARLVDVLVLLHVVRHALDRSHVILLLCDIHLTHSAARLLQRPHTPPCPRARARRPGPRATTRQQAASRPSCSSRTAVRTTTTRCSSLLAPTPKRSRFYAYPWPIQRFVKYSLVSLSLLISDGLIYVSEKIPRQSMCGFDALPLLSDFRVVNTGIS